MSHSIAVHPHPAASSPVRRDSAVWFTLVNELASVGMVYILILAFVDPIKAILTLTMAGLVFLVYHLSISAGAHRLYSHKSYDAALPLEWFYVLCFAGVIQHSILVWTSFHRKHHRHSDTDKDPYSIVHGFWWAHYLWILHTEPVYDELVVRDLRQNKLLVWQHKYYYPLAFGMGLGLPMALGALWGDPLGGLLVGGFLRLWVQYHSTWSINSFAHRFGFQKYSQAGTARFSPYLAVSTVGENNHERHHLAQEDYRLGLRWYHFDIGRWFIELCVLLGLARNPQTVSEELVLARARPVAKHEKVGSW